MIVTRIDQVDETGPPKSFFSSLNVSGFRQSCLKTDPSGLRRQSFGAAAGRPWPQQREIARIETVAGKQGHFSRAER